MTIAFIGYGNVGAPLADHLQRADHRVILAARDLASESVAAVRRRDGAIEAAPPEAAVAAAGVVFLATPFGAIDAVLPPLAPALAGKVLVDCTNPVGPGLSHGLRSEQSGSARVQALAPGARVVKAFTIYGYENLENNRFPHASVKPAMLFCGDDADAKRTVSGLIADLGWAPLDTGGLEQALHLEHLTLLWIRMVRVNGNPAGCSDLGFMYANGDGLPEHAGRAGLLYEKACNEGNVLGCQNRGVQYRNGIGVPVNLARAVELYMKACDGGRAQTCGFAGDMFRDGQGVAKDPSRAEALYRKACDGGDKYGCDAFLRLTQR